MISSCQSACAVVLSVSSSTTADRRSLAACVSFSGVVLWWWVSFTAKYPFRISDATILGF